VPIETRGNRNILVLADSAVPVKEIAHAIVQRDNLADICLKYPVTVDDVFECIDATADMLDDWNECIQLLNVGTEGDIDLETSHINDTAYFNLLAYGHTVDNGALDMDIVYNRGLVKVVEDIYSDIKAGNTNYEHSDLHVSVYNSLLMCCGDLDPDEVLVNLKKVRNQNDIAKNR